jgi:hypothetical protein
MLLQEHLENISGRLLAEPRHRRLIRDLIRSRHGIYALYRKGRLYYVGLARNLMGRLKQHLDDRHAGVWDRFSVYLTVTSKHMKELESLVLRIAGPDGNRAGGRFVGSTDLYRVLAARMKAEDETERAHLLGGRVADRVRRTRARAGQGATALAGQVERRTSLRAKCKGLTFSASLLRDGWIRFRRKRYRSPSAAGVAATGRACDGWRFWEYRDGSLGWVPLTNLRR